VKLIELKRTQTVCTEKERKRERETEKTERKQQFFSFFLKEINSQKKYKKIKKMPWHQGDRAPHPCHPGSGDDKETEVTELTGVVVVIHVSPVLVLNSEKKKFLKTSTSLEQEHTCVTRKEGSLWCRPRANTLTTFDRNSEGCEDTHL